MTDEDFDRLANEIADHLGWKVRIGNLYATLFTGDLFEEIDLRYLEEGCVNASFGYQHYGGALQTGLDRSIPYLWVGRGYDPALGAKEIARDISRHLVEPVLREAAELRRSGPS